MVVGGREWSSVVECGRVWSRVVVCVSGWFGRVRNSWSLLEVPPLISDARDDIGGCGRRAEGPLRMVMDCREWSCVNSGSFEVVAIKES